MSIQSDIRYEVLTTDIFDGWLDGLSDAKSQAIIAERLVRLQSGLFGDHKSVGDGVSELRIDYGPGYRLYFAIRGRVIVIMLCGGDKGSQKRDVNKAKRIAATV